VSCSQIDIFSLLNSINISEFV